MIALRTSGTPNPDFADTCRISAGSIPNMDTSWLVTRDVSEAGKSIYFKVSDTLKGGHCVTIGTLFSIGMIFRPLVLAE
jgi:hypothetical protein